MELNQAKINGVELFSVYGVGISSGLKNMDQPAQVKEAEVYDWEDEHGREYMLSGLLQDSDVTLDCFMKADTLAQFQSYKSAFENMLRIPAYKSFLVIPTGVTHQVKYNRIADFDWKSKEAGKVAATFNLELTIIRGGYNMPAEQMEFVIDDDMILSVVTNAVPGWELNENGDLEMITNE